MKTHITHLLLATTALVLSAPAMAQQAQPAPDVAPANPPVALEAETSGTSGVDDIIVTARREAENSSASRSASRS